MPDPTLQTKLSRFDYQPLSPNQQTRIDVVRQSFKAAAAVVVQNCQPYAVEGVLDRLRSVMSDAVHSIAHEPPVGLLGLNVIGCAGHGGDPVRRGGQ